MVSQTALPSNMSTTPPSIPSSATKTVRKLDIAQVSLNLQDRLGLAKVRFEQLQRRRTKGDSEGNGENVSSDLGPLPSSSSPGISRDRYQTPAPSSPLPAISTTELPRSSRSKHAATFDIKCMEALTSRSRKRRRGNSMTEQPSKVPRISWGSPSGVTQSSPVAARRQRMPLNDRQPNSFVSESATIPDDDVRSPNFQDHSDDTELDPDLPPTDGPTGVISSSIISSSPPRTPPPKRRRFAPEPTKDSRTAQGGADLLLYLANSPTPARGGGHKQHTADFLPSTPPTRHATLPSLVSTPGGGVTLGTPTQPFNFADFVNVTPSPAQRQWASRTPRALPKTPVGGRDVRKRLNFDTLAPPPAYSPASKPRALQLGDELRP